MSLLAATIEGIGFWTRGLPSWDAARVFARDGALPDVAPGTGRDEQRRKVWRGSIP